MSSNDAEPRILRLDAEGRLLSDAAEVIGDAWAMDASVVAIPVQRLDPAFFELRSGVAGEFAQKLVNYRLTLVVVGDISEQLAASRALADWVRESNRGGEVWFVADDAELARRLSPEGR